MRVDMAGDFEAGTQSFRMRHKGGMDDFGLETIHRQKDWASLISRTYTYNNNADY
jgi:hypothetical protein